MTYKYDVAVLGGGVAGVSAAIAAAEMGAKTLLIERTGYLGGMVTGCYVIALAGAYDGHLGERQVVKGNFSKITDRAIKEGFAEWTKWNEPITERKFGRECTPDPEGFKYVLDMLMHDAGVHVMLHSHVNHAAMELGKIVSRVRIEGKFGSHYIEGKTFIDCTGDADMAEYCNMGYLQTNSGAVSVAVRLGGLDVATIKKEEASRKKKEGKPSKGGQA